MIRYEKILKQPQVASNLLGMSVTEFEEVFVEFEGAYIGHMNSLQQTRRYKGMRRRAVGAGRKHKYALRDRLLMTLFWLRAYTTYEVLGVLYGLDKTTVEDNLNDVLETLETITTFNFERPQAGIPKLHSLQDVLHTFPELRLLIDANDKVQTE